MGQIVGKGLAALMFPERTNRPESLSIFTSCHEYSYLFKPGCLWMFRKAILKLFLIIAILQMIDGTICKENVTFLFNFITENHLSFPYS